jgi:hypothetical protein
MFSRVYQGRKTTTEIDKAVDVYAYAITVFQMVTRSICFANLTADKIEELVTSGIRPEFPDAVYEIYKELHPEVLRMIQIAWAQEPEKRPTFSSICSMLSNK